MSHWELIGQISESSPASEIVAASTGTIKGLSQFVWFKVLWTVQGATGGTLDVYLQGKLADEWVDWDHRTQLAAGAAAASYAIEPMASTGAVAVGKGTSPALAANTCVGGYPGDEVRVLFSSGASTSAGATQTVRIFGRRE